MSNHGKRYRKEMAAGFVELQEIVDFCFILRVEEEETNIVPTHLVVGLWAENVAKHDTTTMPSKHRH